MTETLPPDHVRFNGGVSLIGRPNKTAVSFSRASGNEHDHTAGSVWSSKTHPGSGPQKDRGGFYPRKYSFGQDDNSIPSDMEKEDQHSPVARVEHPKYARVEQRTIMARNLSDRASHKDIVDIVRGGALLDLFIRSNERSASISFIDGSAAQNFMNYVKRNDIYIHGKRVSQAVGR